MPQIIPTYKDLLKYDSPIILEGEEYLFSFRYSLRQDRWFFDLSTIEGQPIVQGVKIVIDHPLLRTTSALAPEGQILCGRTDDAQAVDPNGCDFGQGAVMMYFTQEEITDILNEPVVKPQIELDPFIPSNTAPTAIARTFTTQYETAFSMVLTGSDVDGDSLTFSVVSGPSNGTLTGTAPNLTYTPNAAFDGADSFTFKVNDGQVDSAPATVNITVEAQANTAPIADNQSLTTPFETALSITLTASDADTDPLTYSVVSSPVNGVLSGTTPSLTYTPNSGYDGSDSFTFVANDGTVDSNTATISLTVEEEWTPLQLSPVRAYHVPWDFDASEVPASAQARHQNAGVINGSSLSALTDWSSNEEHSVQATGTQQAVIDTVTGPSPMADFDGANDAYDGASLTLGDDFSVFWVGVASASVDIVYEHGPNASSNAGMWLLAIPSGNATQASRVRRDVPGSGVLDSSQRGPWADGLIHITEQHYDGSHASHEFLVDGADAVASSAVSQDPTGSYTGNLYLGARTAGTTAAFNGLYGSLWIFEGLTDLEKAQVRTWLDSEYGGII